MNNKILNTRRSSNKSKIRINSLEKEGFSGDRQVRKINKNQDESSAVQSLLSVIQPHRDQIQWQQKLEQTAKQTDNKYKNFNAQRSKQFHLSKKQNFTLKKSDVLEIEFLLKKSKRKDERLQNKKIFQQEQLENSNNHRAVSYHFRQPVNDQHEAFYDQLLIIPSKSLQKINAELDKQQNCRMNLCFLNRTNAWLKNINSQKKNFFNRTFAKSGVELDITQREQYLHQSFKNFYKKNNISQLKAQDEKRKSQIGKRCSSSGLVKLNKNKAQTVRQMLNVVNQQKPLHLRINTQKESSKQFKQIRSPFDPYKRITRDHHKKFMSFKVNDEKHLMEKLQKLQQKLVHNPEFQLKQDFCIKYLQSPVYCSWVMNNKQKLKPRQRQAPTIKPLKINQI